MAKVLFLLYIPEEEETENAKKSKDEEVKNTDDRNDDNLKDSFVNLDSKFETETSVDCVVSNLRAQKIEDAVLLQDSRNSADVITEPKQTDISSTTCHVPTDKKELSEGAELKPDSSQPSASWDGSSEITRPSDKQDPQKHSSPIQEARKAQDGIQDANTEAIVTSATQSAIHQQKNVDLTTEEVLAHVKKMTKVNNDFWDFGSASNETVNSETPVKTQGSQEANSNKEIFYDCVEETKHPTMTDTARSQQAADKINKENMIEESTDSAFNTCPNTPALPARSTENKEKVNLDNISDKRDPLPNKSKVVSDKSKAVSDNSDTKPVSDPESSDSQTQTFDKSTAKHIPEPVTDTCKLVSQKFDVKPVPDAELTKGPSSEMSVPAPLTLAGSQLHQKVAAVAAVAAVKTKASGQMEEGANGTQFVDFLKKTTMRQNVRDCLEEVGVTCMAWQKCTGDKVWQVTFIEDSGTRCEDIILKLESIGVGCVKKSSISIIPVSIHTEVENSTVVEETVEEEENNVNEEKEKQMQEKTSEFLKSVKSRLVVQQVVKSVESNAVFTFDYVMLVILASVIAALGLVENSSVILVASMLISPLMGPILAGTFGTVIKNTRLRNLGVKSELYGLGICLLCGAVCGLIAASLEAGSLDWRSAEEWPTLEMTSRGVTRGLFIGAMIALPSGAGVALSVLGGNTGSLVGVAISASLLPPAVNAGMLWSAAIVALASPPDLDMQAQTLNISDVVNGTNITTTQTIYVRKLNVAQQGLLCPVINNNDYIHTYTCSVAADLAALGTVSLLLTVLNIFCIFLMGIIVLKIKEVARITSSKTDRSFFRTDIKVARESYTTTKGPQSSIMGKKWLEEYKMMKAQLEHGSTEEEEEDTLEFQEILQSVENSPDVRQVLGRVGVPTRPTSSPASAISESEEMASYFDQAFREHLRKHPDHQSVYETIGHPAINNPRPHLRQIHSVYTTLNRPLIVCSPTPESSRHSTHFAFPASTQRSFATIPEGEVVMFQQGKKKGAAHSLRLILPNKSFHMTQPSQKEAASDRQPLVQPAGQSGRTELDVQQKDKGKRGKKKVLFKFPNKRGTQVKEDAELNVENISEQLPMLQRQSLGTNFDTSAASI